MCAQLRFESAYAFAVWPEASLDAFWAAKDENFLHVDNGDWWEWADAEADLSLRCAYVRRHVAAHFYTMANKKSAASQEMGLQGYMNSKDPGNLATLYNLTRPDSGLFYTLLYSTVVEDHVRGKNEGPWALWSAYAVCKCPEDFFP